MKKKITFEYPINKNIKLFLKTENIFNNLKNIKNTNNYFTAINFFLNISEIYKIIKKYNITYKLIKEFNDQNKKLKLWLKEPNINIQIIKKIFYIINLFKLQLKKENINNKLLIKDELFKQINKKIQYKNKNIFFKKIPEINLWLNISEKKKIKYYKKWIEPIKIIKQSNLNLLKIIRNINTFKIYYTKKLIFKDKIFGYKLIRIKINKKYLLYPIISFINNKYYIKFLSINNKIIKKKINFYLSKCK